MSDLICAVKMLNFRKRVKTNLSPDCQNTEAQTFNYCNKMGEINGETQSVELFCMMFYLNIGLQMLANIYITIVLFLCCFYCVIYNTQ